MPSVLQPQDRGFFIFNGILSDFPHQQVAKFTFDTSITITITIIMEEHYADL